MLNNYLTYLLKSRLHFGFLLFYTVILFTYYGLLVSNLNSVGHIQDIFLYNKMFLKIVICQFFIILISIPLCVSKNFIQLTGQVNETDISNSFSDVSRIILFFCSACMILILFFVFMSLPILIHSQSLYGLNFHELGLVYTQIISLFIFVLSLSLFFNIYLKNSISAMIASYFTILFIFIGYLFIALSRTTIYFDQVVNYNTLFLVLLVPFYRIILLTTETDLTNVFSLSYLSYLFTYMILSVIFILLSIKKARYLIK